METLLLETLQNILNSYNIQTIEEIQKAFVMKNVNLRTKPSKTNSEVIKLLKEGEEVY